mgnify:CR=1 FL=1
MKKWLSVFVTLLAVWVLAGCGGGNGNPSGDTSSEGDFQGVQLKAVAFLPLNHPLLATIDDWVQEVGEATDGKVKIQVIGGPEAIPESEQVSALRNGVVDVSFIVTGLYTDQLPAATAIHLSQLKPWEERESGFYDKMVAVHEELGVRYIGRFMSDELPFRLWLNKPVSSVDELNGLRIRSHPIYNRFLLSYGMKPTVVASSDVYTALQQRIVDGFAWGSLLGPRQNGWTDSTHYVIDHPFFNQNGTILMRSEAWEKIPAEYQEKIIEATAEYERAMDEYFAQAVEEERNTLENMGIQFIQFPADQAESYVQRAYDVEWEALAEQIPDQVEELRSLVQK